MKCIWKPLAIKIPTLSPTAAFIWVILGACASVSLFRDSRYHLSFIFRPSLFVRRECVHKSFDLNIHVKLQKTSETSKSFWALKAIYSLVQCNPLLKHRTIFHHGTCGHVLGNEKVHAYNFHREKKTSPILREINSNFRELAIFPSRIKGIDSRKFSRIANAISEPKIGHVTVRRVCYRLMAR